MAYWKPQHEQLCREYIAAVQHIDNRATNRIYNKLAPTIRYMIQQVSQRYYQIPMGKQKQYADECLQDVFINLNQFNPDKGKAYSFIGTSIKNWYYDLLVRPQQLQTKIVLESEIYDDNENSIDNQNSYQDDISKELTIDEKNYILTFLNKKLVERQGLKTISAGKQVQALNLMIDYLLQYNDFNDINVREYIMHGMKINFQQAQYLLGQLGFRLTYSQANTRSHDDNYNYVIDDHPNGYGVKKINMLRYGRKKYDNNLFF